MGKYRTTTSITHDGRKYEEGSEAPNLTPDQEKELLALGAIKDAAAPKADPTAKKTAKKK